jgi:hypothetical protein
MYETDYSYSYGESTAMQQMNPANLAIFTGFMLVYLVIALAVAAVVLVSLWKLFEKAGKPGWASIVPIYNTIVALEIAGRPWWWVFLFMIPLAGLVFVVIYLLEFVKSYGKDTGYGVLSFFFPYIMFPILAFSKDTKYLGPAGPEKVSVVS